MMHVLTAVSVAVSLLTTPGAQTQKRPEASARTQDIYVGAVDGKGAPVTGLTAADFTVREDGVAREVLKAVPATAPMQVMVLIDDSQASERAIQPMREALTAFVSKLAGKAEIGLITLGERPTVLVGHTTDVAALKKGISRIFSRPGSGSYLLEAVQDTVRGLVKRDGERRIIVVITTEATEFSTLQSKTVLDQLYASGAAMHVLDVGASAPAMTDENRNRNQVIADGTQHTGGRRDQLLDPMSIPDRLSQTADELLHQYLVTYGRPESLIPPEKVQVAITRAGVTTRARTRVAGR